MALRNLSIKNKLSVITMLTSFVALLLACAGFMTYEQVTFRQTLARNYSIVADMTDENVAPGLAFNDAHEMERTLRTLSADEHIVAAIVYDKAGIVAAKYERRNMVGHFQSPNAAKPGSYFEKGTLETFQEISLAGETIGTICIVADLAEIDVRFQRYLLISVLVLLASSLVAFWLSSKLRHIIAGPVSSLAAVVGVVAAEKNYSVRAVKRSKDELGSLIDGFNEMLSEIQARDAKLEEGREKLEQRVTERTEELARERDLLRALMDNSPDHIYFKDRQSRFVRCGKSLYSRFGASSNQEIVGKIDSDFFEENHARSSFEEEQGIIRTGVPVIGRIAKEVWKDGQITWMLVTKMPFHDASGQIVGTFGISKDITSIKEAEARVEKVHQELLQISRLAGMAEVATGVLHNVGNVLNSVNVSATVVSDRVRKFPVDNLAAVHVLFREQGANLSLFLTNDSRGRQIPDYLKTLAEHFAAEQTVILSELESLRKNIEHIKEIVNMQQTYAHVAGVRESVSIVQLVEHALLMNAGTMARHVVAIARDYQAEPVLDLEKHKVLQILVNLMRNAKYACDESNRADKIMTVRITTDATHLRISIIDNGVGIPPENLTRIFAHGFTTRQGGHGFGLHSAALAAKELKGSLTAESDGPGKGATFTLTLPLSATL